MTQPILQLTDVRKAFPGVLALDGVDFDLQAGEVHALLGENGAGKSTLIKIIAGLYPPSSGIVYVDGAPVRFASPGDAIAKGIKVVYQELDLVPGMSVAENIYLGAYPHTRLGLVDWKRLQRDAHALLVDLGLEIDPTMRVEQLRVAEQQLVEIARALSRQARILVMDEPTSALSPGEVSYLFAFIRRLRARGVGIIYISHKLEEVYKIGDRVTVLRNGKLIATQPVSATTPHSLVTAMVGRELSEFFPKTAGQPGAVLLEVNGLSTGHIHDFHLRVRSGEVVGIFGLMGAGIHRMAHALFGAQDRSGQVRVGQQVLPPGSPTAALAHGLALLSENRKEDGIVPLMSVESNLTLAGLRQFAAGGWIHKRAETQAALEYVGKLAVKTPTLQQEIRLLSGGNQQKVLLGRLLLRQPRVLILSEPTRGIDVGSKAEIYRLIDQLAHQGIGILLISTEMPEILGIADRILVMSNGRITGDFARAEATEEGLIAAAAALAPDQLTQEAQPA